MESGNQSLPRSDGLPAAGSSLRDRLAEVWQVFFQSVLALFLAMMLFGLLAGWNSGKLPPHAGLNPEEVEIRRVLGDLMDRLRTGDTAAEFAAADEESRRRMVVRLFADDVSRLRWTWDGRLERIADPDPAEPEISEP